jgi:ergothioneine biosynthesis protein EgtB
MAEPAPSLADRMRRARDETLRLISLIEETDLNRSLNPEFSPIRWHLGHIAAYEAHWVLAQAGGQPTPDPVYDVLFDPTRNPKPNRDQLPPKSEILAYADRVRGSVETILDTAAPDHPTPLLRDGYIGELVYEHECQHQEIMTFLLQMIPHSRKRVPSGWEPVRVVDEPVTGMVTIPEGSFLQGAAGPWFVYDNEREPHEVHLPSYRIDRAPVSEFAYFQFVEGGGYQTESLWSAEGWSWRSQGDIRAPRDWSRGSHGGWEVRAMFETRPPLAGVPVVGVSAHEAEAYARWVGARLPTESEWERASSWDPASRQTRRFPWGSQPPRPDLANTDGWAWGTRSVQRSVESPSGCLDMAGQVWEWTASWFLPYPGFRPFPYEGYSQAWFDGRHRVLRGGSWATRGLLCRNSFRNWYHPHVREIFAGFRCAADS